MRDSERERLVEAARAFVDRLDVIHADPRYKAVWTLALAHGDMYADGPTYKNELNTLRAAIAEYDRTTSKEEG